MLGWILVLVVLGLLGWGVIVFNRLVRERNQVRSAWSDIDVQLTRRHELVPQLVEAVKAYASHERSTLEAVTELRARSAALGSPAEKARIEGEMEVGLHRLIALAEAWPELKADGNFLQLQRDLVEVEDHLQYARRFYNGAVRVYNTRIDTFPDLLVARPFAFRPAEFFAVEGEPVRAAPRLGLH
jgi:LemA protein